MVMMKQVIRRFIWQFMKTSQNVRNLSCWIWIQMGIMNDAPPHSPKTEVYQAGEGTPSFWANVTGFNPKPFQTRFLFVHNKPSPKSWHNLQKLFFSSREVWHHMYINVQMNNTVTVTRTQNTPKKKHKKKELCWFQSKRSTHNYPQH